MTFPTHTPDMPADRPVITVEEVQPGTAADVVQVGPNQKLLHLVRHGQATHNEYAANFLREGEPCACQLEMPDCPYMHRAHQDARLTQRGRLQATAAGPALLRTGPPPQLVIVSPLYRTLQTCAIALSTAGLERMPPIVVDSGCRERFGRHICDMRSPREHVELGFRHFDFHRIPFGPDVEFGATVEDEFAVADRGYRFFLSLKARPETSIAVFSHSSILFNVFKHAVNCPNPETKRRFVTGEVRTVLLTYG